MKPFKAKYRRLVRALTVGLGVSTLGAAASSSLAQIGPDPGSAGPERIVITGSTIPTAGEITESPVTTLDQREIQRSGSQDVLTVLQRREPAFVAGGNLGQTNANIAANSTLGGSAVSIHNLPTLVLFNGRRITDAAALSAGGSQFKDVNLFPVGIINRIEVLKDGASTIYGSDAIGGVVNIISTTDFNGALLSGRYGVTQKSDVSDKRYSLVTGFANDKGSSFVFGAQYSEQDPLFSRTREFARPFFGTTNYPGVIRGGANIILDSTLNSPSQLLPVPANGGTPTLTTVAGALASGAYAGPVSGGVLTGPGVATNPVTGAKTVTGFDLSGFTTITLDQRRYNFYASANQELYGKALQFFGDFLYSDNFAASNINAQPVNTTQGVVIPQGSPFNIFNRTIDLGSATSSPASTRIQVNDRFVQFPRITRTDTNFYRFVAGLHGDIIPNVLTYEAAFNFSKYVIDYKNYNLIRADTLNQAIAGGFDSTGNPVAGGAFSVVNGNVQPALDFFARTPNPASLQSVLGTDIRDLETNNRITDGKLVYFAPKLPNFLGGGQVGISIGGEYREEFLRANIDPQVFLSAVPVQDIRTHRNVRAVFSEVRIPLITPEAKIPGLYSFDIDASGRYEDYSDAGDSEIPKVGFVLRPIADVAIRGTYSKSFIAPNLYQTRGPTITGFTPSINIGQGSEQANSFGGSNPNLSPSTSNNFTGGITFTPKIVPGLTVSADYFYVYQTDIVTTLPYDVVLQSVNNLGPASPYSGLVRQNGFNGPQVTAPGQLAGNLATTYVTLNNINSGGQRVQGVDFLANYTHDFGKIGQFTLGAQATLYVQYENSAFSGATFINQIGKDTAINGVLPQYIIIPTFTYSNFGLTYDATARYIPGLRNFNYGNAGEPGTDIRDYFTFDMRLSYEFKAKPRESAVVASKDGKDYKGGKNVAQSTLPSIFTKPWYDGITLTFGVNNVGDRKPPTVLGATDNTETNIYDPFGRTFYFEASKRF